MEAAYPADEAESRPARGAWIEIFASENGRRLRIFVAPRTGRVD